MRTSGRMTFGLDAGFGVSNATGVALSDWSGTIFAADVIRRNPALDALDAMFDLAERAVGWATARGFGMVVGDAVDAFVTEWPQVYPHERQKDPNKALLPLCGVIGSVNGLLNRRVSRAFYLPHAWKGSIKAGAFCDRVLERLDRDECAVLEAVKPAGLRHNAIDATGLILKHLGRLERARAIHVDGTP